MQRKDYYGILGVARDADESEIKIAYRKLALHNHPDTNRDDPQAEDRFKEINEAYDVLSHRDKRNQYDWATIPSPEVFLSALPPSIPGAIPLRRVFSRHFDAEGEDSGGYLDGRGKSSGGPEHARPASFPIDPISTSTIFP